MGAWGFGIRQDDLVCDIIGTIEDRMKAGETLFICTRLGNPIG